MIAREEAIARLIEGLGPLPGELCAIGDASGRTLASDIIAAHTQPPEPRAMMDGIAVAGAGPNFAIIGESTAGAPFEGALSHGEAVRIATGAVVPAGGDRVVPQEDVSFEDDAAAVESLPSPRFIRDAGFDFPAGAVLLKAGRTLDPAALALAAAANCGEVAVRRRPRVAILPSGDELVQPGARLHPGASIDSASYMLAALIEGWGGTPSRLSPVPDDHAAVTEALKAALESHDVVVPVGGASVGAHDHMKPATKALGGRFAFEKVAVQPGKPCWHARIGDALLLGLPGNPASAFVCAHLFLRPLIATLLGSDAALPFIEAQLTHPVHGNKREQFQRARLSRNGPVLEITPFTKQDSGLQAVLAEADALLRVPIDTIFAAGDTVQVLPLR